MTTYIDLAIDIQKNANSQQTSSLYLGSIQMVGARDFQSITSSSVNFIPCDFGKTFVHLRSGAFHLIQPTLLKMMKGKRRSFCVK